MSLHDIHFWQQSILQRTCSKALQRGVLFLTHPEILTCMVGGQLGFITEFSPAVLTGKLEVGPHEVGPHLGNEHTKPYRIVAIHRKNPLSRASNVLCPMSAGILRVWGILSGGML